MKTRLPIQAKNTDYLLKSILPEDFKMVSDRSSNGYKFVNLLYGVEVDQYRDRLQYIYDNSFLETMDLSEEGVLYEVYLSGIPKTQYLNSTVSNSIPIKIVNWGNTPGDSEFWDGSPTRIIFNNIYSINGIVESGRIVGLNYFRQNPSGYGYFLINTDIDQSMYSSNLSGSAWQINIDNLGTILSSTGTWPGIKTLSYEEQQADDILYPLGSGYLSRNYPLTRRIRDDSGVYCEIEYYEPYNGWVRDVDGNVVALNNYSSDYEYDSAGNKLWHRSAFNNPYGSGNYTVEYLQLRNVPISGTLKLYDLDNLDASGNATEISGATPVYRLQSSNMLLGNETGVFDPIYVGYNSIVPSDRGFGSIEGQTALEWISTSWNYQRESGYVDPDTQVYIEGSGDITNVIKITNPISRYLAIYKYKTFSQANAITSLEGNKYLSYSTQDPLYSIKTVTNNEELLEYQFTRDPLYAAEKSRFITFNGWTTRPGSRISKIAFNIPITVANGPLASLLAVEGRDYHIGYGGMVPDITSTRNYILDCPFAEEVYGGFVTESDLSGSGNYLTWTNTGSNEIYRLPIEESYGKRIRYIGPSGYYKIDSTNFIKDNTFFRFKFRAYYPQTLTLMELSEVSSGKYIKVQVKSDGLISIISNGVEQSYSYDKLVFGPAIQDILIRYYPDPDYTDNPVFELYLGSNIGYTKPRVFIKETDDIIPSLTYLHVYKNCSIDADSFQIYYETNYGTTN